MSHSDMDEPAQTGASLRAQVLNGGRLAGVLVRMPSEELVELAALAGVDFILVDCEHGPADVIELRRHMAVAAMYEVPTIVRVGTGDDRLILRALDQGAQGILSPHTDSAVQAQQLVRAAHYPPTGQRGFAGYSRAGRYGQTPPAAHRAHMLANTLVLGMIESPTGVAEIDRIVNVHGLDGLMIGPADLDAASVRGDPSIAEASDRVHGALKHAGKLRMDIVSSTEAAESAFADGARIVVYNLAHTLMAHLSSLASVNR